MFLMNSPVLPNDGVFRLSGGVSLAAAKLLIKPGFESAIGHSATAALLTRLLAVEVPEKRQQVRFACGDQALVFRLKQRLPEGFVISDAAQLARIPYDFALLERLQ